MEAIANLEQIATPETGDHLPHQYLANAYATLVDVIGGKDQAAGSEEAVGELVKASKVSVLRALEIANYYKQSQNLLKRLNEHLKLRADDRTTPTVDREALEKLLGAD